MLLPPSFKSCCRWTLLAMCLLWGSTSTFAAVNWTGDLDPSDPTTWTSATNGSIGKTALATLDITAGGTVTNGIGNIGHTAGSTGTVTVTGTGSTWTSDDLLFIGRAGTGTLSVADSGAVVGNSWVSIGHQNGSTGDATVDGAGASLTSGPFYVGYDGTGTLDVINGGVVTNNGGGNIGYNVGSVGVATVNGSGSIWSTSALHVGHSGDGTLHVTGGGAMNSFDGTLGYNAGSVGVANVDGVGSTWTSSTDLKIGRLGDGTLNITGGGAVSVAADTWVTDFAGSTGEIHFDGGTLTTESLFANFDDLTGTGTINAKGMVSDVDLVFDATHGLNQTLVVSNLPSQSVTVNLDVTSASRNLGAGYNGAGTMTISGGVAVTTIDGTIGHRLGSTGQVTVDGAGSTWTQTQYLRVGLEGGGMLDITGGGAVDTRWAYIGSEAGSTGEASVDGVGSTWTNAWHIVGHSGNGTLNITDGGVVDTQFFAFIGYTGDSTGQANVNGIGSTWSVDRLDVGFNNAGGSSTLEITGGGLVKVASTLNIDLYDQNGSDFINLSTGGMLAILGDADDSLAQFLGLVGGSDAIRYWDDNLADWADGACDAAGNMTTIPKPNDLANGYTATYDAWNRLVKIVDASTSTTVAEYEYDGLNQRIQKVVNSGADTYDYYYNMKWQAVVEFKNGAANRLNLFSAEYIDALAVTVTATARHFYTHDANYNLTSAITPSAGVAERYSYSPYGKVTYRNANFTKKTTQTSSTGNNYLFTGRRLDAETGLCYFRNRYYSCETGRFVTVDPIRYNGSKWNLYGAYFVPGGVDPWGLREVCGFTVWVYTGSYCVEQNVYDAATGAAGESYTENAGDAHRALQAVGRADPTGLAKRTDEALTFIEGDKLHAQVMQGGRLGGNRPGGGPPVVVGPLPPQIVDPQAVAARPPAQNGGQKVIEGIHDFGPVVIGIGVIGGVAGEDDEKRPELISNPKHHPNSPSPEPANVEELFDKSIVDEKGVSWSVDEDGVIHRFSNPSNGQTHWNGSTGGTDGIRLENIPIKIRRQLLK